MHGTKNEQEWHVRKFFYKRDSLEIKKKIFFSREQYILWEYPDILSLKIPPKK